MCYSLTKRALLQTEKLQFHQLPRWLVSDDPKKKPDVEILDWHGYTWSEMVGCTAKFSKNDGGRLL
jgi:hypothetical protein